MKSSPSAAMSSRKRFRGTAVADEAIRPGGAHEAEDGAVAGVDEDDLTRHA
jgi:hypothetical protein